MRMIRPQQGPRTAHRMPMWSDLASKALRKTSPRKAQPEERRQLPKESCDFRRMLTRTEARDSAKANYKWAQTNFDMPQLLILHHK
jgi:hypothetical protein